jgi:hypothetical protein
MSSAISTARRSSSSPIHPDQFFVVQVIVGGGFHLVG